MKTSVIVCALALAVALGCHTKPAPETRWQRTSETAEPLDTARAACKADAVEQSSGTTNQGLAAKQAAGVFAECMRKRGWVLAESPAR
jgi:hypothetical protein